jgi:hypothetical protein
VFARNGALSIERGETHTLIVPERDGRARGVEEIAAVLPTYRGDRLVADNKERMVFRVGADGKYIGPFAQVAATRMTINGLDDVALLDKSAKSVVVSDRDSKPLGKVLAKGTTYEFDDPIDIAYDALDQLYVLDRGRGSVFVFGPKNRLVATLTIPDKNAGSFTKGTALSLDAAGRLFIFDERARRIQVYQ